MVSSLRIFLLGVVLAVAGATPVSAQSDCPQPSKISCSDAKRQNQDFCANERRNRGGTSYDRCIAEGEKIMQDCLKTGRWASTRRDICGLTRQ